MTHQYNEKSNFFQMIKNNWFLVLFVASVIIGWTTMNLQTQANTERLNTLGNRIEKNEALTASANVQLSAQLGQIQTDLQWIKTKLK